MRPEEQVRDTPIEAVVAGKETVRSEDKIMLVLSYLGIFALIPLLTVKDSAFVQWHARNGLVLGLGGALGIAILSALLGWIPFLGALMVFLIWAGWLGLHIVSIIKALNGVRWRIPGVSDLAEKF
jgi:fumarate reductase subunit D